MEVPTPNRKQKWNRRLNVDGVRSSHSQSFWKNRIAISNLQRDPTRGPRPSVEAEEELSDRPNAPTPQHSPFLSRFIPFPIPLIPSPPERPVAAAQGNERDFRDEVGI
jgi:hypothetical protein